jgi:hypothetical protein
MKAPVTLITNRYEIVFLVASEAATGLNMVDLKVLQAAAMLATPAIADQYPVP